MMLSSILTLPLTSSLPLTVVSPLSVSTLNVSVDPSVIENSLSVPPVRTKFPVPFGIKVISTLASEPIASTEALLLILRPDVAVPISTLSPVVLIKRNGLAFPYVLSILMSLEDSIAVDPILSFADPAALMPRTLLASLYKPVVVEDWNAKDGEDFCSRL